MPGTAIASAARTSPCLTRRVVFAPIAQGALDPPDEGASHTTPERERLQVRRLIPPADDEDVGPRLAQGRREAGRQVDERLAPARAPHLAQGSVAEVHLVLADRPSAAGVRAREEDDLEVDGCISGQGVEQRDAVWRHDLREQKHLRGGHLAPTLPPRLGLGAEQLHGRILHTESSEGGTRACVGLSSGTCSIPSMRILVVNQYFHPDRSATSQVLTELCEDLSKHHEITVICGRPSYNPSEQRELRGFMAEDRHEAIRVLRAWSTTYSRTGMAGRLTNYATYLTSSLIGAIRVARPDVILTMTDPPIIAAAAAVASTVRRVPFVYVNQDVFPEVGVVLGKIRNPALVRSLAALNRLLRRRASAVVAIGSDMRSRLVALGADPAKIHVIPNWADGSKIQALREASLLRRECGWEDRFVVMHSGNVGLSQSLETLVDAAALLRDHEDILIAIVGDGAAKAGLERRVREQKLTNVAFLPYQAKASLSESLGAADIHYVGLKRGLAGFIVPSKVYGILAVSKPYVAAVEDDAEPALIAREHGCGIVVPPGDPDALAQAILDCRSQPLAEMGRRGRAAFEKHYDRPICTDAYRRLLEEVAAASARTREQG